MSPKPLTLFGIMLWWRSGRFADDEFGDNDNAVLAVFRCDAAERQTHGFLSHLPLLHSQSGQRRRQQLGGRNVVETDQGDLPGDRNPGGPAGLHGADRIEVVVANEGIDLRRFRQQLRSGRLSAGRGGIAIDDALCLQPVGRERLAKADETALAAKRMIAILRRPRSTRWSMAWDAPVS